jgi:glycine/D-amino acid oxidase-like deaminating enzyme
MTDSGSRPDVLIVGGGIVGAACAYYLSREKLAVEILDSGFVGRGTTAAGMGHLAVMDDSDAEFDLCRVSCRLWEELSAQMPGYVEWTDDGCLWVAADDEEMALLRPKIARYREAGVEVELLDEVALREAEPELRPGLPGAMFHKQDRVLYQLGATRWLIEEAKRRGAVVREHVEVLSIHDRSVDTTQGRVEADRIVNAAGPWASRLTPELPIEPRKGHLVITDRYPGFCRRQLMEVGYLKSAHELTPESVAFNLQPRATGQMLIGSSRELVGWDTSINRAMLSRMLARAFAFAPRLAELSCIRTWTGIRPATPDKLPYVGRWPATEGLWIAAGHEGLGIMTATGTGRLLTDLILGREPLFDAAPFDPARVLTKEVPS